MDWKILRRETKTQNYFFRQFFVHFAGCLGHFFAAGVAREFGKMSKKDIEKILNEAY
jgi:hypothetical protein